MAALVEAAQPRGDIVTQPTASGWPTLLLKAGQGQISMHSRVDPVREAAAWAQDLNYQPGQILVVLGLAFAYHVLFALPKIPPTTPLVVVEADPEVFREALEHIDLSPLLDWPDMELLVGLSSEVVVKKITRFQMRHALNDLAIKTHSPSKRAFPEYYQAVERAVSSPSLKSLRSTLVYPRLKKQCLNVLLLSAGYFLETEVTQALQHLGHQVGHLNITDKQFGSNDLTRRLLKMVAAFQPDMILAINHLGFDVDGILAGLLADMRLPYASWFVDTPTLILGQAQVLPSDFCSIFVWDEDYVPDVRTLGGQRVYYLPLGTDETTFKPGRWPASGTQRAAHAVGFVGDSMIRAIHKNLAKLNLDSAQHLAIEQISRDFMSGADRSPRQILEQTGISLWPNIANLGDEGRLTLEGLVTWKATGLYRLNMIKALAEFTPVVAGDDGWSRLLDPYNFRLRPPLDYYCELPEFYSSCVINLNATSLQMKNGLNQRVFDIPACGAFILTDWRRQIEPLFEIGREVICYHSVEELQDLARYYLQHDQERQAICQRGRDRVLAGHTYSHRLARLIDQMRQDWA